MLNLVVYKVTTADAVMRQAAVYISKQDCWYTHSRLPVFCNVQLWDIICMWNCKQDKIRWVLLLTLLKWIAFAWVVVLTAAVPSFERRQLRNSINLALFSDKSQAQDYKLAMTQIMWLSWRHGLMLNAGPREPNICRVMRSKLPLPNPPFSLLTVYCTASHMSLESQSVSSAWGLTPIHYKNHTVL